MEARVEFFKCPGYAGAGGSGCHDVPRPSCEIWGPSEGCDNLLSVIAGVASRMRTGRQCVLRATARACGGSSQPRALSARAAGESGG